MATYDKCNAAIDALIELEAELRSRCPGSVQHVLDELNGLRCEQDDDEDCYSRCDPNTDSHGQPFDEDNRLVEIQGGK